MKERLPYAALLTAAILAWWISDHAVVPWIQEVAGYDRIRNRDLSVILGHWVFGQLPRVLICAAVWLVGSRLGLMPSLRQSLGSGVSWGRVMSTGLVSTAVLLVLTVGIGAAAGGTFGFHPYVPKMVGDLVSNLYEEIVYRGLMFCAFYGVAAAAAFSLVGPLNRAGLVAGTLGSCVVFAAGHEQYSMELRVVIAICASVFAYAWVRARSLWAPWIPHTLVDIVGDSILKL
jgi:membrane protease YdiL (CAAX protease family)